MKVIEETESGGDVVERDEELFGGYALFDRPKKGDTRAKQRNTIQQGTMQIPFTVQTEEILSPALDKKGNPKESHREGVYVTSLFIELPFDCYGGKGVVKHHAYNYGSATLDENDLGRCLMQSLGDTIFKFKLPETRD